jgi:hypothetical protein
MQNIEIIFWKYLYFYVFFGIINLFGRLMEIGACFVSWVLMC